MHPITSVTSPKLTELIKTLVPLPMTNWPSFMIFCNLPYTIPIRIYRYHEPALPSIPDLHLSHAIARDSGNP
jgi:hypothetical protein